MSVQWRRHLAVLVAGGLLVAPAAGCARSSSEQSESQPKVLNIGLATASSSLDPAQMNQAGNTFAQPAYDSLITLDAEGNLQPALAESWKFLDQENKVFQLKLRKGVKFADGTDLNADAVVQWLKYLDSGKSNMAPLVNSGEVRADDESTVTITWPVPHPVAARSFTPAFLNGMVASPKALADGGKSLSTATVGTGPYQLDPAQTVAGDHYTYVKNPTYWNPSAQAYDKMVIKVVSSNDQRLNGLKTGQLDLVNGDVASAPTAKQDGNSVLGEPTIMVGLNLMDRDGKLGSPLKDVRVRQAINFALDKQSIASGLTGGYGKVSVQTIVPSEPGHVPALDSRYDYNPEKAKQLLAEAGLPDGFTLKTVAVDNPTIGPMSQVIAQQLEQVGIKLDLQVKPSDGYMQSMSGGEVPAAVIGYGSQPLWMEYKGLFGPQAAFNGLKTSRPEIDDLYTRASAEGDPQKARELNEQLQTYLVDQAWYAPAAWVPVIWFASPRVAPLTVSPGRPQPLLSDVKPA